MRVYLDCYPCFVRQTLEAARMASDDEGQQRQLLGLVMQRLTQLPLDVTPPQVGQIICQPCFSDTDRQRAQVNSRLPRPLPPIRRHSRSVFERRA